MCGYAMQAQTLQFEFNFGDGPGTTTTSTGPLAVTLNMLSGVYPGTPVDAHGPAGSGVQQQGSCLDMTANSPLGNTGTEHYAGIKGKATLGTLGQITNFTVTTWFKMNSLILNNNNNAARFFVLATNGIITTTSPGGANNFGMDLNVPNQTDFPLNVIYFVTPNGNRVIAPIYYNFPTNEWLFVALTYDNVSSNACIYFGSEASPAKLYAVQTIAPFVVNMGSSGDFMLGNRYRWCP